MAQYLGVFAICGTGIGPGAAPGTCPAIAGICGGMPGDCIGAASGAPCDGAPGICGIIGCCGIGAPWAGGALIVGIDGAWVRGGGFCTFKSACVIALRCMSAF
jgi:hypothetical protein